LSTTGIKFKLVQSVKDDEFNVDSIPDYTLSIQIGNESFRFCIVDTRAGKCLWLEDYSFSSILFTEQLLDQLNLIFDDHMVLQAGFWQNIFLSFQNLQYTLIPEAVFNPEQASDYIQLTTDTVSEPLDVHFYKHTSSGMVNVFAAQRKTTDWFKAVYLNKPLSLIHHTSAFIEGLKQHNALAVKPVRGLSVLIDESNLTIALTNGQQLEYCNSFYYTSVQDFTYYVMLVMQELKLDPETCKLTLYGGISHDSAIFSTLYKYIRHVNFGIKPKHLDFGYKFDEVLDHRYFSLYNIHLCR
jgi:hypothetical protein